MVLPLSTPPLMISAPPSPTVVLLAIPPENTNSWPPDWTVRSKVVPLSSTSTIAPLKTVPPFSV